ncbi:MAG: zonular occludens toxin domain-containing protein [Verrucomicrobiota bacterium]
MIKLLFGKPGGGKSLFAVQEIIKYLKTYPDRQVCTNLELNEEEMLLAGVDTERIILLRPEDDLRDETLYAYTGLKGLPALRRFFLVRHREFVALLWNKEEEIDWAPIYNARPDYSGTLFVIDEVHKLFPARGWKDFDQRISTYFSEHRHLGDDVILISQHPKQVDSQIRQLVQTFTVAENMENRRIGILRGDARFRITDYASDPASPNVPKDHQYQYKVDTRVFKFYKSSRAGAKGDFTRKRPGIPFFWFKVFVPIAILAIGLIAYFSPKIMTGGINKLMNPNAETGDVSEPVIRTGNGSVSTDESFSDGEPLFVNGQRVLGTITGLMITSNGHGFIHVGDKVYPARFGRIGTDIDPKMLYVREPDRLQLGGTLLESDTRPAQDTVSYDQFSKNL